MRFMTMGVLAVSLAAVACSGTDSAAPAGNALATPGTAPANRASDSPPVATTGRADEAAAHPAAPASIAWREVTIPAGTNLAVVLDTTVASETSQVEAPVSAHLSRSITVQGQTALAEGARVSGVVTEATRAAKVKGLAHVAVRFNTLTPRGDDQRYTIQTASVGRTAEATKKEDALKIGVPAAGGAIIGGLLGGKKGALIGGGAGGGAGTAVVLSTRGKEVTLKSGSPLTLRLTQPLTVRIKG
jgi:hypothetical protein